MNPTKAATTAPKGGTDQSATENPSLKTGTSSRQRIKEQAGSPTNLTPETGTREIEIAHGDAKGIYALHPIARMFPLLQDRAYDDLLKSLKNDGQQEPCVLDGKTFLDGRNRVAALNQLGLATSVVQFADLNSGLTPAAWVIARNLHRRHLSSDQYLAVVAKYRAWIKEQTDSEQAASDASPVQPAPDGQDNPEKTDPNRRKGAGEQGASEYPQKPADNPTKPKRGRPPGERSEAKALAKEAKQSRYRAEQFMKIRRQSPELATAVEAGRLTLKEALKQLHAQARQPEIAHRKRRANSDKIVNKATQMLAKLAGKLEGEALADFWEKVATFAVEQAEAIKKSS